MGVHHNHLHGCACVFGLKEHCLETMADSPARTQELQGCLIGGPRASCRVKPQEGPGYA